MCRATAMSAAPDEIPKVGYEQPRAVLNTISDTEFDQPCHLEVPGERSERALFVSRFPTPVSVFADRRKELSKLRRQPVALYS
jgi:hypothetical protein